MTTSCSSSKKYIQTNSINNWRIFFNKSAPSNYLHLYNTPELQEKLIVWQRIQIKLGTCMSHEQFLKDTHIGVFLKQNGVQPSNVKQQRLCCSQQYWTLQAFIFPRHKDHLFCNTPKYSLTKITKILIVRKLESKANC